MSAEQVIEAGKAIELGTGGASTVATLGIIIMVFGFIFLTLSAFIASGEVVVFSTLIIVCGMVFWTVGESVRLPDEKSIEQFEKALQQWEESYVLPYVKGLPEEKTDIIYVKVDPELRGRDTSTSFIGEAKRTPMIVGYKDAQAMETAKGMMETSFTLKDQEEPYITYKTIPVDLGHGYGSGIYNAKLYLPESYTFTDMK